MSVSYTHVQSTYDASQRHKIYFCTLILSLLLLATSIAFPPRAAFALEHSEDGAYLIATSADLKEFRSVAAQDPSANARLTADIDMGGEPWMPLAAGTDGFYRGKFDGAGYEVSNYVIKQPVKAKIQSYNRYTAGFFAALGQGAEVKNLTVSGNIDLSEETDFAGGIIGYNDGAVISGCTNNGSVITTNMYIQYGGGIVGYNNSGTITACINRSAVSTESNVSMAEYAGGIAGYLSGGDISGCANYGAVEAKDTDSGYNYAGGIAAYVSSSSATIENCLNVGAVSSSTSDSFFGDHYSGGILGYDYLRSDITNCAWVSSEYGTATCGIGSDENASGVSEIEVGADESVEGVVNSVVFGVRFSEQSLSVNTGNRVPLLVETYPGTVSTSDCLTLSTAEFSPTGIASADVALPNINITGLAEGETTMTVKGTLKVTNFAGGTTDSAVELSSVVSVTDAEVLGVSLNTNELTLEPGGSSTLTYTLEPAYAKPEGAAQWTSSDTDVATVADGVVTAVAEGTATITLAVDGKTATCTVTVESGVVAVESITLAETAIEMRAGEKRDAPSYTITPDTATDKEVRWSSSNPSVFTVDAQSGQITAAAAGESTLTVTTVSGGKSAECTVKVSASGDGDESPAEPAPHNGGSGGGCSAGYGALALLAFVPIALRRMKK